MLTNLHVKNLALIDEAEVEFGPGAVPGVEECPKGALGVRTRRGGKKAGGSISYV